MADYFTASMDWELNTAEWMGYDIGDAQQASADAYDALTQGRTDVAEEVAWTIVSVSYNDALWIKEFFNFLGTTREQLKRLGAYRFYKSVNNLGDEYEHNIEGYEEYDYLGAEDLDFKEGYIFNRDLSYKDLNSLKILVMNAQWFEATAIDMEIEYDEDLMKRSINQPVEYVEGRRDTMDPDVVNFHKIMMYEGDVWATRFMRRYYPVAYRIIIPRIKERRFGHTRDMLEDTQPQTSTPWNPEFSTVRSTE